MSTETRGVGSRLKGIPISLIALFLLAVSLGLGELAYRFFGSEMLRWFMPYFGVAYATWTYVFFYNGGYRFRERGQRLLLFLGLSALGFLLASMIFSVPEGAGFRLVLPMVLSLPALVELVLNRPILRRTPP